MHKTIFLLMLSLLNVSLTTIVVKKVEPRNENLAWGQRSDVFLFGLQINKVDILGEGKQKFILKSDDLK